MPLTALNGFTAPDGRDLHVFRGKAVPSLNTLLRVSWPNPADPANPSTGTYEGYPQPSPHDVTIEFKPVFKCTENPDTYTGFGITVTKNTGAITLDPWPDDQVSPQNFLVTATVVHNGTEADPEYGTALIRIHIHKSVAQVWMTPSRLSVRRPAATGAFQTKHGFTVRAQFDDGTVADITNNDYFAPDPIDADYFNDNVWVSIPATMPVGTVRTVSIRTNADWGNLPAHADIEILEPWATATDVPTASLIDGPDGVWNGIIKPEKVANVLFVGTGFLATDQDAFEQYTNLIVNYLCTSDFAQPYGHLKNSMNYWRVFIPAGEPGVSVRSEVFPYTGKLDGKLYALPVMIGVEPQPGDDWTYENLVYMAGLPIPADVALAVEDPTQPVGYDYTQLKAKWAAIMPVEAQLKVQDLIIKAWVSMSKRTFIDEVNNFPNIQVGEPPIANADEAGLLNFNFMRGGREAGQLERAAFYQRIVAEARNGLTTTLDGANGPNLGNLWGLDSLDYKFDNRQFVVVIANMPTSQAERFFGRSLYDENNGVLTRPTAKWRDTEQLFPGLPVKTVAGRNALVLDLPAAADVELDADTWETVAHELAHTFTLGDEYGETNATFAGDPAQFNDSPNLMAYSAAIKPNQTDDPTIQVDQLKWTWHRIQKAAVLTLPINDMVTGTFRVYVAKGSGDQFAIGDTVRFRFRSPREAIQPNPITSAQEFVVDSIHPENLDNPADPLNMTIVVRNESIGITLAAFGEDCIIYEPIPAPSPYGTIAEPYFTLVPPASAKIMAQIGGTMSGKTCNVQAVQEDAEVPALPLDQMTTLAPGVLWPGLVGAYFGGETIFSCGVLHPAGSCNMRTANGSVVGFCPVCRYVLVDKIDPTQHWLNDRDNADVYKLL